MGFTCQAAVAGQVVASLGANLGQACARTAQPHWTPTGPLDPAAGTYSPYMAPTRPATRELQRCASGVNPLPLPETQRDPLPNCAEHLDCVKWPTRSPAYDPQQLQPLA
jgi:hypothetical protein